MTFDEILKTIRKELNITQEQLARMRLVEYCTKKSISSDIISELERVQDTIKGTGVINYDDNNQ